MMPLLLCEPRFGGSKALASCPAVRRRCGGTAGEIQGLEGRIAMIHGQGLLYKKIVKYTDGYLNCS
jgi:hypothetical protein